MTMLATLALVLHLAGPVDPPPIEAVTAARQVGLAQAFAYVYDHPGVWYSLALEADTAVTWPAGARIMVAAGGDTLVALEAFAVGAPLRAERVALGGPAVVLEPDRLWRRRYRHANVCSVIFARFPEHPGPHVAGVWAGPSQTTAATPAASRGNR